METLNYLLQQGLLFKIRKTVQSYLKGRLFQVKVKWKPQDLRKIEAGVPQGNVSGPVSSMKKVVSRAHRLTFSGLHGVTTLSQKREVFITTAVRTSNHTHYNITFTTSVLLKLNNEQSL
jgi:hypothetical protein